MKFSTRKPRRQQAAAVKRTNDISAIWKQRYGPGLRKACLRLGTTCPNRDGSLGKSGCSFCGEKPGGMMPEVGQQLQSYLRRQKQRRPIVAYLQDHSATYLRAERLDHLLGEIRAFSEVVAIHLGTRPDCLPEEILDVLAAHSLKIELLVEVGLQTANDATLQAMNRGHDVRTFCQAIEQLHARGLRACAHVILGLPMAGDEGGCARPWASPPTTYEGPATAAATARLLTQLGVEAVKIHNCHVLRGTPLASLFEQGVFCPPSLPAYVDLLIAFLQHLDPAMEIHRLLGQAHRPLLLTPDFTAQKARALIAIRRALEERGVFQGQLLADPAGP